MTRRVQHAEPDLAEPDLAALGQLDRGYGRRDLERRPQWLWPLEHRPIQGMYGDRGARVLGDRRIVADVIPVAVGADDELERPPAVVEGSLHGVQ